jgi:hypothetical protein
MMSWNYKHILSLCSPLCPLCLCGSIKKILCLYSSIKGVAWLIKGHSLYPHRIQDTKQRHSDIGKNSFPHRR